MCVWRKSLKSLPQIDVLPQPFLEAIDYRLLRMKGRTNTDNGLTKTTTKSISHIYQRVYFVSEMYVLEDDRNVIDITKQDMLLVVL